MFTKWFISVVAIIYIILAAMLIVKFLNLYACRGEKLRSPVFHIHIFSYPIILTCNSLVVSWTEATLSSAVPCASRIDLLPNTNSKILLLFSSIEFIFDIISFLYCVHQFYWLGGRHTGCVWNQ